MERCFTISESSELYRDYTAWQENFERNTPIVRDFLRQQGIKAKYFSFEQDVLYIAPTDEDLTKFHNQFKKVPEKWIKGKGLFYAFKKNSSIGKVYIALGLKVLYKPLLGMYIDVPIRRCSRRLFMYKNILYVTLESDEIAADTEFPEGWEEIKRSDFYKVLEEMDE